MALNATNFFLAQIASIVAPFLNVFLKNNGWRYDQIGLAIAAGGLASLLFQLPVGFICDRLSKPQRVLGLAAVVLGACYVFIPLFVNNIFLITALLFISGIPGTFFAPLMASISLSISKDRNFHSVFGENQGWNHAGSGIAGVIALVVVYIYGVEYLFYLAAFISVITALIIQTIHLKGVKKKPRTDGSMLSFWKGTKALLKQKTVVPLLIATAFFHVINGGLGVLTGLYMKELGSSDARVAWLLIIAQPVMIPVSFLVGRLSENWGRKVFVLISFFLLPLRLLLYIFATTPNQVIAITALDGVISGVFGVVLVFICNDLTKGKQNFNTLMGLVFTIPAIGGLTGVTLQGFITEYWGFKPAFMTFAALGLIAAFFVMIRLPETKS